jgi:DNA repair protein RecN (Recombination protein N)
MLAVKTVLAENDNIPILIFDEIDTGIGGVLAKEVAKTMYKLSNSHQIICISHLHQIASVADNHYRVYKVSENGRTVTKVEQLNDQKKVEEISRMLGSDSTLSKRHAEEFLELRKTFH